MDSGAGFRAVKGRTIADRLFEGIPAGMPETACLLRLVEVSETTEVPTAAIDGFDRVRLRLNPEFVERHAATPGRLFMLLMHEIHHVALGHTRRRAVGRRDNFALDAVINAMLSRRFPEPEFTDLLTSFYPWEFPHFLLRPPPVWPPPPREEGFERYQAGALKAYVVGRRSASGNTAFRRYRRAVQRAAPGGVEGLPVSLRREAASTYARLYMGPGATVEEVAALLPMPPDGIVLLGSHGRTGEEGASRRGEPPLRGAQDREPGERAADVGAVVPGELAAILEETDRQPWLGHGDKLGPGRGEGWGFGRGDGKERRTRIRRPPRGPNNRARLRRLIERVADQRIGGSLVRTLREPQHIMSPLPKPDRRSVVLGAFGVNPLLRAVPFPVRSPVRAGQRVHLYLDVSGCVHPWVGPFYRAVLDCREWVHPEVHLFSTAVRDVSFAAMRRGQVDTDQGHDISCVTKHMRRHRIRRACILTCPHVGTPRGADRDTLARAVLGVALLEGPEWRNVGLKDVADYHTFLRRNRSS